ncbi:hypothetical protein C8R44DRAFT_850950 [Mycena epipterygia]|nr:hypothetical protein C8R44DRAFT_850950 [Mycena epipterygia]
MSQSRPVCARNRRTASAGVVAPSLSACMHLRPRPTQLSRFLTDIRGSLLSLRRTPVLSSTPVVATAAPVSDGPVATHSLDGYLLLRLAPAPPSAPHWLAEARRIPGVSIRKQSVSEWEWNEAALRKAEEEGAGGDCTGTGLLGWVDADAGDIFVPFLLNAARTGLGTSPLSGSSGDAFILICNCSGSMRNYARFRLKQGGGGKGQGAAQAGLDRARAAVVFLHCIEKCNGVALTPRGWASLVEARVMISRVEPVFVFGRSVIEVHGSVTNGRIGQASSSFSGCPAAGDFLTVSMQWDGLLHIYGQVHYFLY